MRTSRLRKRTRRSWWRIAGWIGIGLASLLILANGVMWCAYRGKVLPNVSLGALSVSNIAYDQLDDQVDTSKLLASQVLLTKEDRSQTVEPANTGVVVDWPTTRDRLKAQRSWFPLLNLVVHRTVPTKLTIDQDKFKTVQTSATEHFTSDAQPERITFNGQDFVIAPPEDGYALDQASFEAKIIAGLEEGNKTIEVPTTVLKADTKTGGLDADLQTLRKKLSVKVKFTLNGQVTQPGVADIGSWYAQNGRTMALSTDSIKTYVAKLGNGLFNTGNAALATSYALDKNINTTFALASSQMPHKYTYCAATKSVEQSYLPSFKAKVAAVLGDPRSWTASGKVAFEQVDTNCDFSIWLSAAAQMPSFGGDCDSMWSCRSGRNVVINFDRWQGATDAWNAAGGNLEDYHVMVTNHEVGHWLGFGHRTCPGPGQLAPVMQQQSINLQGCTFNPWPTPAELAALK